jgi:hypothetical protein
MKLVVEGSGQAARIALPEILNEKLDVAASLAEIGDHDVLVFDFDACLRTTSLGIREWIRLLRQLPDRAYYCFIRCRPSVMAQFNFVVGFAGRGELVSMYVPYACPKCSDRFDLLIDVSYERERVSSKIAPRIQCTRCLVDADLDEPPSYYFSYVSEAQPPSPRPEALPIIAASMGRKPRASQVEIAATTILRLSGLIDERTSFEGARESTGGLIIDLSDVTELSPKGAERLIELLARAAQRARVVSASAPIAHEILSRQIESALPRLALGAWTRCDACGKTRNFRIPEDLASDAMMSCCGKELQHVAPLRALLKAPA